jgi:hypothetical protein
MTEKSIEPHQTKDQLILTYEVADEALEAAASRNGKAENLTATTNGSSALALASLVGTHSPIAGAAFSGPVHVVFPVNEQIPVEADAIACSAGSVDITAHLCKLTFGPRQPP